MSTFNWNKHFNNEGGPRDATPPRRFPPEYTFMDRMKTRISRLIDRVGKGRTLLIFWAILALPLIVLVFPFAYFHNTHNFMGTRLRVVYAKRNAVRMVDSNGNYLTFSITRDTPPIWSIEYLGKSISRTRRSSGRATLNEYTFSDGSTLRMPTTRQSTPDLQSPSLDEFRLLYHMHELQTQTITSTVKAIGISMFAILGLLLGLVQIMYPEQMWRVCHILTVENGEPTDIAIFHHIIVGIVTIILAYTSFPTIWLFIY